MKCFLKVWFSIFISSFLIEIIFRLIAFNEIFNLVTIRIFLFTLTVSIIMALFISTFKPKITKIIIYVYIFLISFYGLIQLTFHNLLGNYMSFRYSGTSGLTRVLNQTFEFIKAIKPVYLCLFVPFILLIVYFKKSKFEKVTNLKKYQILFIFLIGIGIHIFSLKTLSIKSFNADYNIINDKELYKYVEYQELGLNRLGLVRFLSRDITRTIFPKEKKVKIENNSIKPEVKEDVKPDYTRKIDDTVWKEMIKTETNQDILNLDNYYINRSITPKNEYTGMFKDKNMILIMAEAFDYLAIDQNLTPTLYKLSTEGWLFNKNYRPKYNCTTGTSEFIGLVSLVPTTSVCAPNYFKNNYYPTSIFSLFNNSGYYSTSYHNFTDKYYSRTIYHKNMGSVQFYNRDLLKNPIIKGWPSDKDLVDLSTPLYMDKDKFFSFIITSSTHFPYDETSAIQERHWDQVKDLDMPYKVKTYMAKAIELDQAIANLLADLEEHGKLENTVIAIYGDHHPLRMELSYIRDYSKGIDRTTDLNIDLNPFIIYTSNMEAKTISTLSDTFDILPTIANLFDLDYDPRYYFGSDIFSNEEHLAIFNGGSWISDKGYYNAVKGSFKPYVSEEVSSDYISNVTNYVKGAFDVSSKTLYEDYYRKRFK